MSNLAPAKTAPSKGGVTDYVRDAHWLPHVYDPRADALTFLYLTRERRRSASFLAAEHLTDAPQSPPVPVPSIAPDELRAAAGPTHFIFHTAFCCSTLLTRALDVPGVSAGLCEPNIIMQFAKLWSDVRRPPGAVAALQAAVDLLSRPFEPGEVQVIKPSNAANHLIPSLLHVCSGARAVIITSSLELFLTAVVRRGAEGRLSVRQFLRGFVETLPFEAHISEEEALLLTDLQAAALAWLMQVGYLNSIVARFGDRVRVLDCDTFLARPAETLSAVGAFFGLGQTDWRAVATGPVFNEHAKNLGRPFNAAAHAQQQEEARALYRKELGNAWAWARSVAQGRNLPFGLKEDLLASAQ